MLTVPLAEIDPVELFTAIQAACDHGWVITRGFGAAVEIATEGFKKLASLGVFEYTQANLEENISLLLFPPTFH